MSPRSASHRPRQVWKHETSWEYQTFSSHLVPSMGLTVSVGLHMVGKTRYRKADQLVRPDNATMHG